MKKKRETCKYCGGKMEAKTTRQEFCSPKCRVYWNRQTEPLEPKIQFLTPTPKEYDSPKINRMILDEPSQWPTLTVNQEIKAQIDAIKAEKIPPLRDTLWGRKSWNAEQKQRIAELEKRLYGK